MTVGRTILARGSGLVVLGLIVALALASPGEAAKEASLSKKEKKQGDRRWINADESSTGRWSCAGTTWEPTSSGFQYASSGAYRHTTTGGGSFRCNVNLPNNALMRSVTFTVRDTSTTDEVDCQLERFEVQGTIGAEAILGNTPPTGDPDTPGDVRLADPSIDLATIDNTRYVYFTHCSTGANNQTGIWGADIEYTAGAASA